jgi:hypothetical protein
MAKDIVIPLVFPDYKISVSVEKIKVDVLPWFEFDDFTTPQYKEKISNLGHAGVLFINGKTGVTKYFEYGRYDPPKNLGLIVKARGLPDAKVIGGEVDFGSIKNALGFISRISGQSGRIQGVFISVENKYQAMLDYAMRRKSQNGNPNRKPYDLVSNSWIHFVKNVTESAGIKTPWMADPRPNSYIGEFRSDFPDLDYKSNKLKIEGIGVF